MSEQALDLKRSLHILRRHKIIIIVLAAIGLVGGAAYSMAKPPMLSSTALVALPPTTKDTQTQVLIAGSTPVLALAQETAAPSMSLQTLRDRVQVKSLTVNLLSVSALGKTADQAEDTANAVANSYVNFVRAASTAAGKVQAHVLQRATNASGRSLSLRLALTGVLGMLLGGVLGSVIALAISRGDKRLRERDDIADAIGVPVLASIPVAHPSDASRWSRLLDEYKPGIVHAWQLRNALRYLGQTDFMSSEAGNGAGFSLAVLSLSSDPGALALGPQLAVFATSLGIPTALVVCPGQDPSTTAALHAACAAPPPPGRSHRLHAAVASREDMSWRQPGARLTVVVAVVDGQAPQVADTMRTDATVIGVCAGVTTAVQLAAVAVSAATDGRHIDGILVADPDSADHTTGRVPQLGRPSQRRTPTRVTGVATETRR
jgi:capsular polysaccharide biosynthesis protein